jgi:FtsZ-binding cell division protein ZapB
MEKSVKNEAQNYVSFFMLKNDDNELSREIQNIKKAIEELRSETRQLENNLDYFSNTSNDNPLFQDVTSRLNDLNAEIDNHKEKLVGLRKFKREIEARDAISSEENETQSEEENTT